MKLYILILLFLSFVTALPAQDIQLTISISEGDVRKPLVERSSTVQRLAQRTDGLPAVELPVTFKSFEVDRLSTKVDLVWETSTEMNNAGFEIQRRADGGEWQKVAFVLSQAPDGKSKSLLTYEYNDVNVLKEGSEYRLKQLDNNKRTSYSETRSIKGY